MFGKLAGDHRIRETKSSHSAQNNKGLAQKLRVFTKYNIAFTLADLAPYKVENAVTALCTPRNDSEGCTLLKYIVLYALEKIYRPLLSYLYFELQTSRPFAPTPSPRLPYFPSAPEDRHRPARHRPVLGTATPFRPSLPPLLPRAPRWTFRAGAALECGVTPPRRPSGIEPTTIGPVVMALAN